MNYGKLAGGLGAFVALGCAGLMASTPAFAADDTTLEEVIVTGSLIPQAKVETAKPVTVISSEDLQKRGFTNVADALQQASMATGSIQNAQFSSGFTPGVNVISLFGLSPGYTKILIDGLPVADYPALYNGSDVVTSISGIPMEMVDRMDILPGGNSSIYGSDAIAGVVNIIMKKKIDGPFVDVRFGATDDGGGASHRFAAGDGFSFGGLNVTVGGEYERTNPIWGYQRPLTNQFFANGTSPQVGERDTLLFGYYGYENPDGTFGNYYFADPDNCANMSSQFNGTDKLIFRPGHGNYCGTTTQGYYTIGNGDTTSSVYVRGTEDLTDHLQIYANALWNHDVATFSNGTYFYGTSLSPEWSYYLDPNITGTGDDATDYLNLQKIFSPEEAGGLDNTLSYATTNAIRVNAGVKGSFGESKWTYDVGGLYTQERLVQKDHQLTEAGLDSYFGAILGTPTYDPINGTNIFTPDYTLFYQPVTPAEYASYSAYSHAFSYTQDSSVRAQLTDSALFPLPGGDAGLALVAEGGNQNWRLTPDPGINAGLYFGPSSQSPSDGHRSRVAGTGELRLPVLSMLTVDASGRYDKYSVVGQSISKTTYDLSLEFRPFAQLLARAHYGTAFKAPSLSDEFQKPSGAYTTTPDYLTCYQVYGTTPADETGCTLYENESVQTTTSGNPALKPITAKVWGFGVVYSATSQLTLTADYLHWGISNEVAQLSLDRILQDEYECYVGILDPSSGTCQATASYITRDPVSGALVSVATPKINVGVENLNAFVAGLKYRQPAGVAGEFDFEGSWSDLLKHQYRVFPDDAMANLLFDPIQSQEFKTKLNASVSWTKGDFGATLYMNRYGRTPNYLAAINGNDYPGAGKLSPWTLFNLSARYQIMPSLELSVYADNLFNKMPPTDNTYPGSAGEIGGIYPSATGPAYNNFDYNNYGRSYLVEINYHFRKE